MQTFPDSTGRTWALTINTAAVKRVRTQLDVNLLAIIEDGFKLFSDLTTDFVLLVDVLYVLCKAEADQRNVSDEDFGRSMAGDCLGKAADALIEELVDFFPDARKRTMLKTVIAKSHKVSDKALAAADKMLAALNEEQLVMNAIDSASS